MLSLLPEWNFTLQGFTKILLLTFDEHEEKAIDKILVTISDCGNGYFSDLSRA